MNTIQTVTGPVQASQLGLTLIHEHVLFGYPGWHGDVTLGPFDREACLAAGIVMAEKLKSRGVRTILDATPNETGRDPEILREISERTGVQFLCSTGYYYERGSATPYFKARSGLGKVEKEIFEMFAAETTRGIAGTGIKAAVIKLASSRDTINRYEQWFFKAAARASRELGTPIITHTQEGKMGPEQAAFLIGEGADPKRIMIGHICGNTDMAYHLRTLEQGVYIGFDRFGIEGIVGTPTDRHRMACLVGLVGMGYADRILLSHDYVAFWLGRAGMASLAAGTEPTHLFDNILPALRLAGVTDGQIRTMMVDNPRRFLSGT
jgi:phosphotriesterase-related protein